MYKYSVSHGSESAVRPLLSIMPQEANADPHHRVREQKVLPTRGGPDSCLTMTVRFFLFGGTSVEWRETAWGYSIAAEHNWRAFFSEQTDELSSITIHTFKHYSPR